ncbi:MAG: hypothetical protein EKK61_03790 [Rickettsiales bacterium]|nr:MAG: hypothetical protein EKK61_03790 [Rickettsiales bacterium]
MEKTTITIDGKEYILKSSVEKEQKIKSLPIVEGTPYKIGGKYLIRTITMIYTGELVNLYNKELILKTCAWIPDTGRWKEAVEKGTFNEVEPYPIDSEVIINRDVILDVCLLNYELPKNQK